MRCAICGLEGASPLETAGGTHLGHAHKDACQTLLWEAHFVRVTGGTPHEHEVVLWQWRRRRAEVQRKPFDEPPPTSPAEDELDRWIQDNGLMAVAKEFT